MSDDGRHIPVPPSSAGPLSQPEALPHSAKLRRPSGTNDYKYTHGVESSTFIILTSVKDVTHKKRKARYVELANYNGIQAGSYRTDHIRRSIV